MIENIYQAVSMHDKLNEVIDTVNRLEREVAELNPGSESAAGLRVPGGEREEQGNIVLTLNKGQQQVLRVALSLLRDNLENAPHRTVLGTNACVNPRDMKRDLKSLEDDLRCAEVLARLNPRIAGGGS